MTKTPDVDAAASYIWHNARLLERRRYSYLFGDEGPEPVVAALEAYRNPDGGFGNALEPDLRTPASQPVPAEWALRILAEVDEVDPGLCDWLVGVTTEEGGAPFVLDTAAGYPHAPWWEPQASLAAHLNPTAAIVGLLIAGGVDHPWLAEAEAFCWRGFGTLDADPHTLLCVLTFLDRVPDRDRAAKALEGVREFVMSAVTLDAAATGYVKRPLDFAPRPEGLSRTLFTDEQIEADLDRLIAQQEPEGSWPVPWPAPSEAAFCEWRGVLTLEALITLRAYGRL